MTLIVSFLVILLVAALVGRVCSRSRPGERHRAPTEPGWPGLLGGSDLGATVHLPDTAHHHSGWGHAHSDGGWGGDSGGGGSD